MASPSRLSIAFCLFSLVTLPANAQQRSRSKQPPQPAPVTQASAPAAQSAVAIPRAAGPQTADDEGRTLLPLQVEKTISFRQIGPAISGGRIPAVAGVPGQPFTFYVGTADGGIFRTTDGGISWKALFQHETLASIGDVAVDPTNPDVIWIGTGESNIRNDVSFGDGVYRSTDGGAHWNHMGLDATYQISRIAIDPHSPGTVIVAVMGNPWADSPDRGIYRTVDGGKTWQRSLYIGPSVGISDLAMDPKNPQVLYAGTYRFRRTPWSYTGGGPEDAIYKSVDEGQTWTRLSGHGLPTDPVTRIGLAVAPSEPNVVYAVIGSNEGVVWRSNDSGEHWNMVSKDQEADPRPFYFSRLAVDPKTPEHVFALANDLMESKDGGKTWKAIAKQTHVDIHAMWIDPEGSGSIIEGDDGGVVLSRDNGVHWQFLDNIAIGQFYHLYADNQRPFFTVCGGLQDNSAWCGLGASQDDKGILDRDWIALNGGDGIYAIPASDNSNLIYNSTQNGYLMAFDRTTQQAHNIEPYVRTFTGGGIANLPYRFNWNAGFAVSPSNPAVIYQAGNVLFRSQDRGRTWQPISPDLTRNDKAKQQSSGGPIIKDNSGAETYDTILTVTIAQKDPNVIWVGTDDGLVQITRDDGAHWTNVSGKIPGLPEWSRIESIDVSADNAGEAVIAVDNHYLGDFKPYLFRTTDYGATWNSIAGNLPANIYAHVVRMDHHDAQMYYAGLENGAYVTWDGGAHWYLMGLGLPNASVYDLYVQPQQNDLIVGTHGRSIWILDDLTPFDQYTADLSSHPLHLFPIRPATRFWHWSQVEWLGDGAFYGKNPSYGADINYYVGAGMKNPGKVVITDAQGKIVRTLEGMRELKPDEEPPEAFPATTPPTVAQAESKHNPPQAPESRPTTAPPATQAQQQVEVKPSEAAEKNEEPKKTPWVPVEPGLHRIYWDLHAQGPVRWEHAKEFLKGPKVGALVPPGEYTAAITVDGQTMTEKFQVINDPRSHVPGAELQAQYQAAESALHKLSQLDVALNRLDGMRAQVKALQQVVKGTPDEQPVKAAADQFEKQIDVVEGKITSHPEAQESILRKPLGIREYVSGLRRLFEGSDQAPTQAALDEQRRVETDYKKAIEAFNDFLGTAVTSFNNAMAQRKVPGVLVGEPVQP